MTDPSATASPAAEPTADVPAAPITAGTVLTAEQAAGCAGSVPPAGCVLPRGARAYALPDGTFVAVTPNERLPAAVIAGLEEGLAALPQHPKGAQYLSTQLSEAAEAIGAATRATGKWVVVVVHSSGSDRCGDSQEVKGWAVRGVKPTGDNECVVSPDSHR